MSNTDHLAVAESGNVPRPAPEAVKMVRPCEIYGPDKHPCCGEPNGVCEFDRVPDTSTDAAQAKATGATS